MSLSNFFVEVYFGCGINFATSILCCLSLLLMLWAPRTAVIPSLTNENRGHMSVKLVKFKCCSSMGSSHYLQCAAVRTKLLWIRIPPHVCWHPTWSETMYGREWAFDSSPFTMPLSVAPSVGQKQKWGEKPRFQNRNICHVSITASLNAKRISYLPVKESSWTKSRAQHVMIIMVSEESTLVKLRVNDPPTATTSVFYSLPPQAEATKTTTF